MSVRILAQDGKLQIPDTTTLNAVVVKDGVVTKFINVPTVNNVWHPEWSPNQDGIIISIIHIDPKPEVGWLYDAKTRKFTPVDPPISMPDLIAYAAQVRYSKEIDGVYVTLSTGRCIVIPTDRGDARSTLQHQRMLILSGERKDGDVFKYGKLTATPSNADMMLCCQMQTKYVQACFNLEHDAVVKISRREIRTKIEIDLLFANIEI